MPIVKAIKAARKKIDIFIFRLDCAEIEKALAVAVQRGGTVRALIAHTNRGGEARLRKLEQRLLAAGVLVSGFNLTKLDIEKSRSFAISTRDTKAVHEASRLFESDVTRHSYTPGKSNLVISHDNARAMLSAFIKGARRELVIYDPKVFDAAMIKLLKERAAKGVNVRVLANPTVARKLLQVFESDWADSGKSSKAKKAA